MNMKHYFYTIGLILFVLSSCERAIDFDIKEVAPKLVVEATIENDAYPIVLLSNSLGFFSTIDLANLSKSFVRNAEVFVSDGVVEQKLKEFEIPLGGGNSFFYYTSDPANTTTAFKGAINKRYGLRIVAEGKLYSATTSIPFATRRIDSLYHKPAPVGNKPEQVALMVMATDKPGFGDYVRYFTKRNSEPFYAGLNSVYDDQVIDGSSYDVQVERGVNRNIDNGPGSSFFNKGDTVTIKLANIDKATDSANHPFRLAKSCIKSTNETTPSLGIAL